MRALLYFSIYIMLTVGAAAQNRFYDSMKQLLANTPNDKERLALLDSMGTSLYLWTYPDTARKYAQQQLGLARKLNNAYEEADGLNNYGTTGMILGYYAEALAYAIESDELAEAHHDYLHQIGNQILFWEIYRDQDDFRHALFHAYRSKQLIEQHFTDKQIIDFTSSSSNLLTLIPFPSRTSGPPMKSLVTSIVVSFSLGKRMTSGSGTWAAITAATSRAN